MNVLHSSTVVNRSRLAAPQHPYRVWREQRDEAYENGKLDAVLFLAHHNLVDAQVTHGRMKNSPYATGFHTACRSAGAGW